MTQDVTRIADELFKLESAYQKSGLSEPQTQRWDRLIVELLENLKTDGDKRRNLRLPALGEVLLIKGAHRCSCKLEDLSHFGLRLRGDFTKNFRNGDAVELRSVEIGDKTYDLRLPCTIAWKQGRWHAGIEMTDKTMKARQTFFKQVYYPTYLDHLRRLAHPEA